MSAVYVLRIDGLPYIKVGWSDKHHYSRKADAQTYCPLDLVVCGTISGPRSLEGDLHKQLRTWRTRGEWFRICEGTRAFFRARAIDLGPESDAEHAAKLVSAKNEELVQECDRLQEENERLRAGTQPKIPAVDGVDLRVLLALSRGEREPSLLPLRFPQLVHVGVVRTDLTLTREGKALCWLVTDVFRDIGRELARTGAGSWRYLLDELEASREKTRNEQAFACLRASQRNAARYGKPASKNKRGAVKSAATRRKLNEQQP